jgi:hypothetical protein
VYEIDGDRGTRPLEVKVNKWYDYKYTVIIVIYEQTTIF